MVGSGFEEDRWVDIVVGFDRFVLMVDNILAEWHKLDLGHVKCW